MRAWCVHDNQHLLNWAALDLAGAVDFDAQLRWLASVLTSRGYPLDVVGDLLPFEDADGDRVGTCFRRRLSGRTHAH